VKRNGRILLHIEEVFALQFSVLHATPRIHTVGLDLDIKNSCGHIWRREGERGVPLVELSFDSHRRFHIEGNYAFHRGNLEDGETPSAAWPGLAHKDRLDTRKQRAAMGIMRLSFRVGAAKKERSTLPELLTIAASGSLRYFNVGDHWQNCQGE